MYVTPELTPNISGSKIRYFQVRLDNIPDISTMQET